MTAARVALVNTPDPEFSTGVLSDPKFPIGLLYVAAALIRNGHEVRVFDCHASIKSETELSRELSSFAPLVVGLNCMTANRKVCYRLSEAIRENFPNALLLVGGTHATLAPEDVLDSSSSVDAVIVGEGEETIPRLVGDVASIHHMEGIVTRTNRGSSIVRRARRIRNLDSLPFPAYELIDVETYFSLSNIRELYLSASRGCPFNCTFCCVPHTYGVPVYFRSAENVIEEIDCLVEKYCVNRFYFYDENLLSWPSLSRFCKLSRDRDFYWTAQGMAKDIDDRVAGLLEEGGCLRISLGIESGSQRIQGQIKKPLPLDLLRRIGILCARGIGVRGFFIVGFPDETLEDLSASVRLMLDLREVGLNDICVFPARPYPRTELLLKCRELYPDVAPEEFLSFEYVSDWKAEPCEHVADYLRKYNTIPAARINRFYTPAQTRRLIREIYYIWCNADDFATYSLGKLTRYLQESTL